jgi:NADH-quinone oxidoreductase subunit E
LPTIVSNEEKFKELEKFMEDNKDKKGMLIMYLHKAQEMFGYLPKNVMEFISVKTNIPESTIYGVATFYAFFSLKPKGKYEVKVCLGTACYVKGGERLLERFRKELGVKDDEADKDGLFNVKPVRCIGACSMAPAIMIGDDTYGRLTPKSIPDLLDKYKNKEEKND